MSRSGILCGCDNGTVVLLNSNLARGLTIQAHGTASPVTQVTWAGDELHFLSVATDKTVKVWSLEHESGGSSDSGFTCIYTIPQMTAIVSACFHPLAFAQDAGPAGTTLFVLTVDRRIGVWTNGMVQRYETLSPKDPPVCMATELKPFHYSSFSMDSPDRSAFVAIGTKTGDLLIYSYVPERGIFFEHSIMCRNRRGPYSDGTPIVSIVWTSPKELLVASQDNRIRLVRLTQKPLDEIVPHGSKIDVTVVKKFRGHKSSSGEAPLAAFLLTPPFTDPILQCGSECGRVYVWPVEHVEPSEPNALQKIANKFKTSRALLAGESWQAVNPPDKLTALGPAPWHPEKGSIGGSCTVTASLAGVVRIFFNTPPTKGG